MKIDRYYVDSDGLPESDIVIRDHISPLRKITYPTDIAVKLTTGMFASRESAIEWAKQICFMLNAE